MATHLRLSFLAKLLLALVGSVGLLLAVTLLVLRAETQRQVRRTVTAAVARSREAFAAVEDVRQGALRTAGERFTGNNRFPASVEEAVATGETGFLLENALYDLTLAGTPRALAAFTGLDGRPVAALLDSAAVPRPADAVPPALPQMALRGESGHAFGYHLLRGRLFSVYTEVLGFFEPVGTLTLGAPVDGAVAEQLVKGIPGAQVCFVAAGRCVAATPGAAGSLAREMVAMAGRDGPRRVRWRGGRLALVSERVLGEAGMRTAEVWRVTAVPLDDALRPLESIQRALLWVGLGSLAVAVGVGTVLARGFARPVRRLVEATEHISRGDYAVRVAAPSRDELGTLADAFNEMAQGLMLKERYRGVLDKVVSRSIADELLKGEITLGGETRRVTTLFADVRGFTTLTEGMDPARVVALLNEYAEAASAAVEAEGGVVDKYVGDEVMAVFGAPLPVDDHARRGLRAAVRIRDALAALNAGRRARGEPELRVGIGVNTGLAVAGNMGSTGRLNYTVLGESVNVASRLCDLARGGEILTTRATLDEAGPAVEAAPRGEQALRGLSAPVALFAVDAVRDEGNDGEAARPAAPLAGSAAVAPLLLLGALLGAAVPAGAQGVELPTLEELGVGWTSPGGFWQVSASGRLHLEGFVPGVRPAGLIAETDPFASGRLSLFVDVLAGSRLLGMVELRADRGEAPSDRGIDARVEQAFVRVLPLAGGSVWVQAGKFVSPFGAWPERHFSPADPFIRPPLPYDHRTLVSARFLPGTAAGFAGWKDDPATFRPRGAPVVWDAPYPLGALAAARWRGATLTLAVLTSAPSSEPGEWNSVDGGEHGPSFVARAGWQVSPEVRLGASYDVGSYLQDDPENAPLPAGTRVRDYVQEVWGFDAAVARGPVEVRGELLLDRWEVPNVGDDPRDLSYYLEGKVRLGPGLFAAARYGAIHFSEIAVSPTDEERWDHDVRRLQLGAGYRLGRTTELRAEYMLNRTDAAADPADDLFSVRWSYEF